MAAHGALSEQDISALRLEMSKKRSEHGLTYDALAKKSSVSRRTVISIETGSSRGSLDSWMRIFTALDSDFGTFLQDLKQLPASTTLKPTTDDI
jgi:DNA-binding XRE family transcriptional regulator